MCSWNWRENHAESIGKKGDGGTFPQLFLRREKEQGPLQGCHGRLFCPLCPSDGRYPGRDVRGSGPDPLRTVPRCRCGLALLCHDGADRRFAGSFRQRVQHLLHAVPAKGQRPAAVFAHSGFRTDGLQACDGLPHGPSVFRRGDASGDPCLLGCGGIHPAHPAGRAAAYRAYLRLCHDGFLRPGLCGGEDQPEAEAQESDHRHRLSGLLCRVLLRGVQGADPDQPASVKRAGFWRSGQGCCLSHLFVWPGGRGQSDSLFGYFSGCGGAVRPDVGAHFPQLFEAGHLHREIGTEGL